STRCLRTRGSEEYPAQGESLQQLRPWKGRTASRTSCSLDRRLFGDSSMGTTVLVDFETFKRDVLPPLPPDATSEPLDEERIQRAQTLVMKGLQVVGDENKKSVSPKEDQIAETMMRMTSRSSILPEYKAALSRYKADPSDDTQAKVDGGLYLNDCAPPDDRPDWTHCRLYIEFKKGNVAYDPWDDRDEKAPESDRSSRKKVRDQLIAYAQNIFHYQHRTALLSLFIIGEEFRVMWWDRSGVIVSQKTNYYKDQKPLLEFIWHFAQLSDEQQGLDPTATLIKTDDEDFKLMNYLAGPHALDMDYLEPGTEEIVTDSPFARWANNDAAPPDPDDAGRPQTEQAESNHTGALDQDADVKDPKDGWKKQPVFKYVRQQFRESLARGWPRYRLEVGEEKRVFLVAKPIFRSSTMFGRATRGYVAVDVQTRAFVFLKDSWRPFYVNVDPEGAYLEEFKGDEAMHVPTILCHGDVSNQVAFTAGCEERAREARKRDMLEALPKKRVPSDSTSSGSASKKRAKPDNEDDAESQEIDTTSEDVSLRHHIHYRIAVKEVCLPFSEFRTTEQLLRLLYHCIETHYWAYERHHLLHRDVSAGNVLILPRIVTDEGGVEVVEWCGILTDWELAKRVPEGKVDAARQPERTGTWQFMSVDYVACNWTRPSVVADELESFLHVLVYYAVRFLPSSLPSVTSFVILYFDTFTLDPTSGQRFCSPAKTNAVRHAELKFLEKRVTFRKTTGEENNPLNRLIATLLRLFAARYAVIDHELTHTKAEAPRRSNPVQRASPATRPRRADVRRAGDRPWFEEKPVEVSQEPALIPLHPQAKEEAAKLDSHAQFLRLILQALDSPDEEWRDADVTGGDQLINYEPRLVFVAAVDSSSGIWARKGGAKRLKTDTGSGNLLSTSAGPSKLLATDPGLSTSRRKGNGRARKL
ncbi:hypothetical protein BV20DRAFT_1084536, partial [Pilatotrama ljubarskyi]